MQSLHNKNITIYGTGNQTRSFCYIDDLITGLMILMKNEYNGPINWNPNEITIKELAKNIIKLTNTNSKIIYKEIPEDDPEIRKPDINKAKQLLKWNPKIDLIKGLTLTINYFKSKKI